MGTKKKPPHFKSEKKEKEFWWGHDSTEYIDWSKAKSVKFKKLKPTTRSVSVRLPETLIEDIKILANLRDVPYQSYMKVMLTEMVKKEYYKEGV